jgi:type IV secretion system protein VirB2
LTAGATLLVSRPYPRAATGAAAIGQGRGSSLTRAASPIGRSETLAWNYPPASPSLADPTGSSAAVAAVQWLQGTLLGTVATTVAVISIAGIGLMMLSGRIDLRRGASVILGCFILFGASGIASGIRSLAGGDPAPAEPGLAIERWDPAPLPPPAPPSPPASADPYAGAAVPNR